MRARSAKGTCSAAPLHQSSMGLRSPLAGPAAEAARFAEASMGRHTCRPQCCERALVHRAAQHQPSAHAAAGAPLITLPWQSKWEPWQGQSKVFSIEFHCSRAFPIKRGLRRRLAERGGKRTGRLQGRRPAAAGAQQQQAPGSSRPASQPRLSARARCSPCGGRRQRRRAGGPGGRSRRPPCSAPSARWPRCWAPCHS